MQLSKKKDFEAKVLVRENPCWQACLIFKLGLSGIRKGQRCVREYKLDHMRTLAFSLNVTVHFGELSKNVHCLIVHFKRIISVLRKKKM